MEKTVFIVTGIIFLVLIGSLSSVTVVDTGHRGVKRVFQKVEGEPLSEGIYFNSPFTTDIVEMDIRTQKMEGSTEAYTRDVQQATVSYVVNYSLNPKMAGHVLETIGADFADRLVPQAVFGTLKSSFGKWEAVDVVANREKVRAEAQAAIAANLQDRGINIERFEITNIDYSPEFEKAVEAKVTAVQLAEQAKNQTVRIQEEANQKVVSAKAEAESMRIRADSLTQNRALVDYEAVQKWDGKLPQYMMGNSVPFINISKQGQ